MAHRYLPWSNSHKAAYGFTYGVSHLMYFEFWEPIIILDEKNQFPESHNIFSYYAGPDHNKGAIDWSWVWTREHGLLACSILRHDNRPKDNNRHMVPVSVDIEEEYFNSKPVNFIFANRVNDWTDDEITETSYKNTIDTTHHLNKIIDNNIITGKKFLIPKGKCEEVISAQFKVQTA